MNAYEKFLTKKIKNKNTYILTAENLLAIRNIKRENICDVGICEQNLIGVAAGIAKNNGQCYVHALSNFLISRAYEFLKIDLDYNNCNCVLVGSMGGIQSTFNGPTHQSIDEMSILENFLTFEIFFPLSIEEMVKTLENFKFKKNLYVRYNPEESVKVFTNKKNITNNFLQISGDCLIVSNGILGNHVLGLIQNNKDLRKKFSFFNFSYLKKNGFQNIAKKIFKFKKILVIEDHLENGSIFSRLNQLILKNKLKNKLKGINLGKNYFHTDKNLNNIYNNLGISQKKLMKIKL